MNARKVRKQREKRLPSGVAPEYSYACPDLFGGHQCLQPVNPTLVDELLEDLQEEKEALTDWRVPESFKREAESALERGGIEPKDITVLNVWLVFSAIYNRLVHVDYRVLGISVHNDIDDL